MMHNVLITLGGIGLICFGSSAIILISWGLGMLYCWFSDEDLGLGDRTATGFIILLCLTALGGLGFCLCGGIWK